MRFDIETREFVPTDLEDSPPPSNRYTLMVERDRRRMNKAFYKAIVLFEELTGQTLDGDESLHEILATIDRHR